jgi:hypothetical protein
MLSFELKKIDDSSYNESVTEIRLSTLQNL